ncbi:MAG: two-component system response regulator [Nitrospiria bacterium]
MPEIVRPSEPLLSSDINISIDEGFSESSSEAYSEDVLVSPEDRDVNADEENAAHENDCLAEASTSYDPETCVSTDVEADPVEADNHQTSQDNSSPPSDDQNIDKEKVLVCLDGEATQEAVQELLEDSGYHILDIPSEMASLMAANMDPPNIALIDTALKTNEDMDLIADLKSHPSLKDTKIIFVGSMFEKNTKYRDYTPALHGADDYIDRYYLRKELVDKIKKHLKGNIEDPEGELNVPKPFPTQDMATETEEDGREQKEQEEAIRLARIIVSDIVIYNEEKFSEGIQGDNIYNLLAEEIEEGRQLYASRVSEALRAHTNYLEEAIKDAIHNRKKELGLEGESPEQNIEAAPEEEMDAGLEQTVYSQTAEDLPTMEEESEAVKNAKRLARIVVSDIVIYNEDKAEEGVSTGRFFEILEEEIEEGRQLYASRIDADLLEEKDYLQEAFEDYINKKKSSVST